MGNPLQLIRRRRRSLAWRLAVLGAAAVPAVGLAGSPAGAAFTASTGNGADRVSTAASFCTSPGSATVGASADVAVYQSNPTTNYGTVTTLGAGSGVGANLRTLIQFSLPALPHDCRVTAATLRLYANSPSGGRTIDAYRIDPTAGWTESGATWNIQPAVTGTPVGSASLSAVGWQQWPVTGEVQALYAGTNNGLLLRDATEGNSSVVNQLYDSREGTNKPQLVLSWG